MICGAVTGLAGMLYTANYAIGYYGMADGFEMTAIAICVLGGVSITGGKGRMDGVAIGALIMSVITYFISMIHSRAELSLLPLQLTTLPSSPLRDRLSKKGVR